MNTRQETIRSLPTLAAVLVRADEGSSLEAGRLLNAVRATVTAECIQCGMTLSGEELVALANPQTPDSASHTSPGAESKLARLRLGYCARSGCNSAFYRINLPTLPGIEWERILPEGELAPTEASPEPDEAGLARRAAARAQAKRALLRGATGVVALLILMLIRQWYRGGTIPFLREPEHFQVDVDPIYRAGQPPQR